MSLREEMRKYEQITGESAEHVPIIKLGAFLDGYEMGLKALEQQPCEDCISREAVMKCFKKWQPYMATRLWDYEQELKDLPSVTPQQTRWIPIKTRPMTEEEKEHFSEYADSRCDDAYTMLDCPLPDDGQEVIVSSNGYVGTDIFCRDSTDGCYFEGYDIDDVDAWMPLPEPYKEERG